MTGKRGSANLSKKRSSLIFLLLLAACGRPAPAANAEAACTIPNSFDLAETARPPDPIPDAPVSGYVLALSWSPEFCRFRADAPQHRGQCRDNDFGFIVHGLWPQAGAGPHPRACRHAMPVTADLVREHYCMMPSEALIEHQWAAHGTCAFDDPAAYFAATEAARDRFEVPDLRQLDPHGLTVGAIRQAFADIPAAAVGIEQNARGWIEEVRLCLDMQMQPRACTQAELGPADDTPALVWRGGAIAGR